MAKIDRNFSKQTMYTVLARDNYSCFYCGSLAQDVHHVLFKSRGGMGVERNGVCVCRYHHDCCHGKVKGESQHEWFDKATDYLKTKYEDWSIEDCKYKKGY